MIGFADESALLKHELAYCLGQTKNKIALPTLVEVLRDEKEDPMVRHEVCLKLNPVRLQPIDDTCRQRKPWARSLLKTPFPSSANI
jgi:deoxyhypusine monooxygenase